MREKMNKKPIALLVGSLGLAVSMSANQAVFADPGRYLEGSGTVVTNNYGECWNTKGGRDQMVEACGDVVEKKVMDSDGDGVPDDKDKCPGTPAGAPVDADGCPLDSDGDGVPDYRDKCPGTPKGAKVDADGCEMMGDITINLVNDEFDFDSAELKPDMKTALDGVIDKLKSTPSSEKLVIVGHTDSIGSEEYNEGLSMRRAQAVADYLSAGGIDSGSMDVTGLGEAFPVADNGTDAGRSQNRRVEIKTQ